MCVILYLKKGQSVPFEKLCNATWNNWHSFGMVVRMPGKNLVVERHVPEIEVDPKFVMEQIEKYIQHDRFIHLRHTTAGATDIKNCHPLEVFKDPKSGREVLLMHNGTLHPYVSKKLDAAGKEVTDFDGPSDTKNYVDEVLKPYLTSLNTKKMGDIHNPLFDRIVRTDFKADGNRIVLISSDQEPVFYGDWKEREFWAGEKVKVSNDFYFDSLQRGPEFSRQEAAKKIKEEAEKAKRKEKTATVVSKFSSNALKSLASGSSQHPFFRLSESPSKILNDWEIYDRKTAVALGALTVPELDEIHSNKADCISLMDWIFADYALLFSEFEKIEEKHSKASKYIATLVGTILKNGGEVPREQDETAA
ncbi:MAG: hypothetical protein AB7V06_25615 [Candidatus Obscuribacterales bacterium]